MGYADAPDRPALDAFLADYRAKTLLNRKILDHLLHDAFSDDTRTEAESTWCSIPIRRRSGSPRCWASTRSAT